MTLPTEPVGSIPRPKELIEGMAAFGAGRISARRARGALRRRGARHAPPLRGDGLSRRHRRRAAEAELRDLPDPRRDEPRARRRDDPVQGRPHPATARADLRALPLRDLRRELPRGRAEVRDPADEGGRDRRVGALAAVSRRRHSRRIRARSSSTTSSARRRPISAAASPRARRSRSTSPRAASASSSILRRSCSIPSST